MATFPPLLWEKTGEWSDGCFIQALVQALGKSRCSYLADTALPLASAIIEYITLCGHIILEFGVYLAVCLSVCHGCDSLPICGPISRCILSDVARL